MESILAAFLVIITSPKRNHQNISLAFFTVFNHLDVHRFKQLFNFNGEMYNINLHATRVFCCTNGCTTFRD